MLTSCWKLLGGVDYTKSVPVPSVQIISEKWSIVKTGEKLRKMSKIWSTKLKYACICHRSWA